MRRSWEEAGPSRQYARLRALAIAATLIFALAMSATLILFQVRSERAVKDGILTQARAHAQAFDAVRIYVQGFSGIYVPSSTELTANPLLAGIPGVTSAFTNPDGKQLVLQNAPCVARNISSILAVSSKQTVRMGLTALNPMNPWNEPDTFARYAITELDRGNHEAYAFGRAGKSDVFHYAVGIPLSPKCGKCHPGWVGKTSGVAGATVVRLDVTRPLAYMTTSRMWTGTVVLLLLAGSAAALYVVVTGMLLPMYHAQRQIYDLAHNDSLTGLSVRRIGVEALAEEVARAARDERCVSACMIDLDDFKAVNDDLGHSMGDQVLALVGEAISDCLRPYDTAARVGGEEFLLVLPGACAVEADEIMERVRAAIAASGDRVRGLDRVITCSAGIAVYDPPSSETAHELFSRADQALLAAKRAGKNRGLISGDSLLRSTSVLRPTCPASNMDPGAL